MSANPKSRKRSCLRRGKAESVEKITVDELIHMFEIEPPLEEAPFSRLYEIFKDNFLDISADKDLVDLNALAFSGGGTPVVTSAREKSRRNCSCREKGITNCSCERYYSQLDCDIGWGSISELLLPRL